MASLPKMEHECWPSEFAGVVTWLLENTYYEIITQQVLEGNISVCDTAPLKCTPLLTPSI